MKIRKIFIAHSWTDVGINFQTKEVAKKLSETAEVLFLTQARIGSAELKVNDHLTVEEWPNKRPRTWKDFIFIIKKIRKGKPDVIIVHFGATNLLTFAAWLCRVKHRVCWLHTLSHQYYLDTSKDKANKAIRIRKWIYRLATHIVAPSEYAAIDAKENYLIPADKIYKIENGVKLLSERMNEAENESIRRVRYIGRLDYSKGVDILLSAFANIESQHKNVVLEIAGKGSDEAELIKQAEAMNLADKIFFIGHLPKYEDAVAFISGAYILTVPSRIDNLPTVIIEAMSVATPVIAANSGGISYMVSHEKNGLLVPSENVAELGKAIERLLIYPEFRNNIAAEGKKTFDSIFTIEKHVANVVAFLNSLS